MNDTMSLLLATGILAVGGLGLFMYKNSSEGESFLSEEENGDKKEENWFDLRGFFGNSNDDEDDQKSDDEGLEVYETKTKSRGSKTKSVRKTGGTKRRY
jgi:hypothetical protein